MININHILIVRFSLKTREKWHLRACGEEEKRSEWFAMRAEIFRLTLHASLMIQKVKPRKIFILMDENDRPLYKQHLNLQESIYVPIFSPGDLGHKIVAQIILETGWRNLALSRIDSDDLVCSSGYFEEINKSIFSGLEAGVDFKYIVNANGLICNGRHLRRVFVNYSPFLTLYVDRYRGESVYAFPHGNVRDFPHLVSTGSRWMQYVHGTNIGNRLPVAKWFDVFLYRYVSLLSFDVKVIKASQQKRRRKFYSELIDCSECWPSDFPKSKLFS